MPRDGTQDGRHVKARNKPQADFRLADDPWEGAHEFEQVRETRTKIIFQCTGECGKPGCRERDVMFKS